ncbi:MAG: hypothetical protein GDA51_03960 [Ekhidna sp.]|nr:hypothetical protein [Ekhidna sp.]
MVKQTYLFYFLLSPVFFSCGDDDGDDEPVNTLTFKGTTYTFEKGFVFDEGSTGDDGGDDTHYRYYFQIGEKELEVITDEEDGDKYADCNQCVNAYFQLLSPGISGFKPGTFEFVDTDNLSLSNVSGKYLFEYADIEFIMPGDDDGTYFEAISGTVTVKENSNLNYTLTCSMVVQETNDGSNFIDGTKQTVSFSFTGDFTYIDNR